MKKTYLRVKWFGLFIATFIFHSANAVNYYFSASEGDDSRTDQQVHNPKTPWKSLDKLNKLFASLHGGDSVLLKRGDVFEGFVNMIQSGSPSAPIVLSTYGSGDRPIVNGFIIPNGWTNAGGGIWEKIIRAGNNAVSILLLNGVEQGVGRYPNRSVANDGYLNFESFSGTSSITDNELNSVPDWTGGEIVIRKNRWVLDRNFITQHDGNTIRYISESGYAPSANFGYYIQNHLKTLDQVGEWYYKKNENKLGIYLGQNPNAALVEVSVVDRLLGISGQQHLVIEHISFRGAGVSAIEIRNAQHIKINDCNILYSGTDAVTVSDTDALTIENSEIDHTHNIALNITDCNNTVIRKNSITNTGTIPGMGKGDSGSYEAILISGNNNLISFNQIDSTGYIPITFSGNEVSVMNNFISNFLLVKDDGGGIYTWNNGNNPPVNYNREITGNIIINGRGAGAGTDHPEQVFVHGIYMDDNAGNVTIQGNTVAGCGTYGIFIHNAHDIIIQGNTLINNQSQLVLEHDNIAPNSPVRNIRVTKNVLFSTYSFQEVAKYKTISNDLGNFGFFDSNFYCRPMDDRFIISTTYQNNGNYYQAELDLDGWKALYQKDLNSKPTPVNIMPYRINNIIGGNQYDNGNFNNNAGGLYVYSQAGNSIASWSNGGLMDGGSLKLAFSPLTGTSNHASLIIGIGQVYANKNYILRFSLAGSNEHRSLETFLRKSLSPYQDLSERKLRGITSSRTENEVIFTPSASEADASIVFDIQEQGVPLYMDNIQLYEASVSKTNPADSIRFEYNASSVSKVIVLDGTYVDAKSNSYTGSITLEPFASVVLIRQSSLLYALPSAFLSFTGRRENNTVMLQWDTENNGQDGYFEVERSLDGPGFIKIGMVAASNNAGKHTYSYTDMYPGNTKMYYRIKWVRKPAADLYTSILYFSLLSGSAINLEDNIDIVPNPASNKIKIFVRSSFIHVPGELLIQSVTGSTVNNLHVVTNEEVNIDISSIAPGTYIVSFISKKQFLRAKFVKY